VKKVTVALDKVREIRYSINAIVELEDMFNVPASQLFAEDRVGLSLIRSLTYVGLKHGGMKFNGRSVADQINEAGELIQEHWIAKGRTLKELMDFISQAFTAAGVFQASDEKEEDESNPQQDADEVES